MKIVLVNLDSQNTVWKFHNFAINKTLREIDFGDSTSAKSAILSHFEPLNLDFHEFLHFWKAEIHQMNKSRTLQLPKSIVFKTSRFSYSDFTQNSKDGNRDGSGQKNLETRQDKTGTKS